MNVALFNREVVHHKNLPLRSSILTPLFLYVSLGYLNAPSWVFVVLVTLWTLMFIVVLITNIQSVELPEITKDTFNKARGERGYTGAAGIKGEKGKDGVFLIDEISDDQLIKLSQRLESLKKT